MLKIAGLVKFIGFEQKKSHLAYSTLGLYIGTDVTTNKYCYAGFFKTETTWGFSFKGIDLQHFLNMHYIK